MAITVANALERAISAHKNGELEEAEKLYRKILDSHPQHPDANHNLAVLAVSVGRVESALPHFKIALESNRQVKQFWLSYINALVKLGQLDAAKEAIKQSRDVGLSLEDVHQSKTNLNTPVPATNPDKAQIDALIALYSRGKLNDAIERGHHLLKQFPNNHIILNVMGHIYLLLDQPKKSLTFIHKAIKIKEDFAAAHNNLGNVLRALEQYSDALSSYRRALQINPNLIEVYNNLGIVLKNLERYDEAEKVFKKAIMREPNYPEFHINFGNLLQSQKKHDTAVNSYNRAIYLEPSSYEPYYNRGNSLNELGSYADAISSFYNVLALKAEYPAAYDGLARALANHRATGFSEQLANNYLEILNLAIYIRPGDIYQAIITLLKCHETVKKVIDASNLNKLDETVLDFCVGLSKIPLFLKILELSYITDLPIEGVLVKLRRSLLLKRNSLSKNHDLLKFQRALALQCFHNEFIYEETEEETFELKKLEKDASDKWSSNNKRLSDYNIACLASYRPLHNYSWARNLKPPSNLEQLFSRQITEVQKQREIRGSIPILKPLKNKVSRAVQSQYEENPYPRWINTRLEPKPLSVKQFVNKFELQVKNDIDDLSVYPQVLIAGCGTGQHAINSACRFKNSQITAVDLSLNSLSYAKRKTDELGIKTINFVQADILDLELFNKQFDVIECVGTLVCMADPYLGLETLTRCLKSKGLIRIGLYSELARQAIVEAREIIAQKCIPATAQDMRAFRRDIIINKYPQLNSIKTARDFFSMSELRDLLFHVQEHRFSLPQIEKMIGQFNLSFSGFEFPDTRVVEGFKKTYPSKDSVFDLSKWHEFELENPSIFRGMYQFWVQKD